MSQQTIAITVHADVNAPLSKVWECWNAPEHIVHWNFANDDWHSPKAENDFHVGGKFTYTMAAKDGSFSFDFWGIYTEIYDQNSLAYSLGDDRKVKVTFEDKGGRTQVTETFDAESQNPVEMQQAGWQAILNNFKKYVESL